MRFKHEKGKNMRNVYRQRGSDTIKIIIKIENMEIRYELSDVFKKVLY
jgi:hypothetical protein